MARPLDWCGWHRQPGDLAATGRRLAVPLVLLLCLVGCARQPEPIFAEQYPSLVWPPAPHPARIRYVGQLRSASDLKKPTNPFEQFGKLLAGPDEPQPLYGPQSVLYLGGGPCLWVADPGGRCLHRLDLATRDYRKIERAGEAPLLSPVDVCAGPSGSIYVCDSETGAIHRFAADTGVWLDTVRLPQEIVRPVAVHFDDKLQALLVVDVGAHDIKVLEPSGKLMRIIGARGGGPGQFNYPCDVDVSADVIWVVDAGNQRIQGLSRDGTPLVALGQPGDAPGDLALPKAISIDSDGHLYVVDGRFENVQVFDQEGQLLLVFGEEGTGPAEFWLPTGLFIDHNDRIWVCDTYNGRIQVFDYVKHAAPPPAAGPSVPPNAP